MPHYDRFDIVEAHYWFCVDYHEGQCSDKYAKLCRIREYFTPSPICHGPVTWNAREIYNALVENEHG